MKPIAAVHLGIFVSWFVAALPACSAGPHEEAGPGDEATFEAEGAMLDPNAMNLNAMNLNAMNLNAMNLNALNLDAMAPIVRDAVQSAGPSGDLARQALQYMVGCALRPGQSLSVSWVDVNGSAQQATYQGDLGLEPGWIDAPLSVEGRSWISACLASRVNYYGVSVLLSSRASHPALSTPEDGELAAFKRIEGAFWGDLFLDPPEVYACHTAENVDYARSKKRDCAAGHVGAGGNVEECGILHIVGSCNTQCAPLGPSDIYYRDCSDDQGGAPSQRAITVALQ